jgi:flavin-binding protein dodecin
MAVTKLIDVVGHSSKSADDAVREAISAASRSIRGITRADVVSTSCQVADGQIVSWDVTVKIAFPVERSA